MAQNAFLDLLRQAENGTKLEELADELRQLVAHVKETGKPSKLTITLTCNDAGESRSGAKRQAVSIDSKLDLKKRPAPESIFFVDGADNLTDRDPHQPRLPGVAPHYDERTHGDD